MNTQPLSRRTVEEIEDILDMMLELGADGELCLKDQAQIRKEIEEAYECAIATDEAQTLSVAMMRNGPNSQRVKRLTKVYVLDRYRKTSDGPEAA